MPKLPKKSGQTHMPLLVTKRRLLQSTRKILVAKICIDWQIVEMLQDWYERSLSNNIHDICVIYLVQQDETLYIFAHPKPLVVSDDKH